MIHVECNRSNTIQDLLILLETEPLNPALAAFVEVISNEEGLVRFCGNFANISRPFSVVTDDVDVIRAFMAAIKNNTRSAAYKAEAEHYFRALREMNLLVDESARAMQTRRAQNR